MSAPQRAAGPHALRVHEALALLEAATARSGVETTKSFVTEHGLIFAYMH